MKRVLTAAGLAIFCAAGAAGAWAERAVQSNQMKPSTFVGCLRAQDDGSFMLTEVGGPGVPEARSWRSLYMTKERVLDVEPARGLDMRAHVGHTVKMTGRLEGRTLHAGSMTLVGATCK